MKTYRVGVLGCGQIAQIMHLPYLHDLPGWKIHSLCDLSAEVVNKVAEKYGIDPDHCYTDYDQFLKDGELDVVLICSKDHCEPAVKAAQAGKHIFVEKPFGFNRKQARAMVDAAKLAGVKLMVGYMKRYDTGFEELQKLVQEMEDISLVRFHDYGGSFAYTREVYDVLSGSDVDPSVFAEGKQQCNSAMLEEIGEDRAQLLPAYSLLLGVFCHDVILMRHLFGNNLEVLFTDVYGGFANSVLKAGNTRIIVESGLVMARHNWDEYIEIYSPQINIRLEFPWPYLKNAPSLLKISDHVPGSTMVRESVISTSFEEAYRREWQHFYRCLEEDRQPLTNGEDAFEDIALLSKIIKTVKAGV